MNIVDVSRIEFANEHWKNVFNLLDQVQVRYAPRFGMRGTQLHEKWGAAYEQVVNIMYWADRLARNSPSHESTTARSSAVRNYVHLRFIAYELRTTTEAIHAIMLQDPDYDGELESHALAGKE